MKSRAISQSSGDFSIVSTFARTCSARHHDRAVTDVRADFHDAFCPVRPHGDRQKRGDFGIADRLVLLGCERFHLDEDTGACSFDAIEVRGLARMEDGVARVLHWRTASHKERCKVGNFRPPRETLKLTWTLNMTRVCWSLQTA